MAKQKRSLVSLLQAMAQATTEPVSFAQLVDALQPQWHGKSDRVHVHMRASLRRGPQTSGWLEHDNGQLVPVHVAVRGQHIRVRLREHDVAQGVLPLEYLAPFVVRDQALLFPDVSVHPQPTFVTEIDIRSWMFQQQYQLGDDIVVSFDAHDGHCLHLSVDRLHLSNPGLDEYVLACLHMAPLHSEVAILQAVLLAYTTAPAGLAIAGTPWQTLLERVLHHHDAVGGELVQLRQEIDALQTVLRSERTRDSENGLWDGISKRYSALRIAIMPDDAGSEPRITLPPIDMRFDYARTIDEGLAQGIYDVQMIHRSRGEDIDDADLSDDLPHVDDDDASGFDESDDYLAALQSESDDDLGDESAPDFDEEELDEQTFAVLFANRHPALEAWSIELLQSLSAEQRRQIIQAETDEDYNIILSRALQRLLPHRPHFMQTLQPTTSLPTLDITDGGQTYASFELAEYVAAQLAEGPPTAPMRNNDVFATGGEAIFAVESVLRESEQYITAYVAQLKERGMRPATVRRKYTLVHELAVFLARYYTLPLQQLTYAHLDEYVYFYFPRHTNALSPRVCSDLLRAVRDLYERDDRPLTLPQRAVARAMYDRRQTASDVLRILSRLHQYPLDVTALVVHLFAPYTA